LYVKVKNISGSKTRRFMTPGLSWTRGATLPNQHSHRPRQRLVEVSVEENAEAGTLFPAMGPRMEPMMGVRGEILQKLNDFQYLE
jgi:hypothetical protein